MSNQKTIALIVAALVAVAAVFLLVLFAGGTPRALEPSVNKAPSGN